MKLGSCLLIGAAGLAIAALPVNLEFNCVRLA